MKKKRQHYVFQAYLASWVANDKIYCLRDGSVFASGLNGVACERFFYKIQNLSKVELDFLNTYVLSKSPTLRDAQERFLSIYVLPWQVREAEAKAGASPDRLEEIDEQIVNGIENHHSRIEDAFLPFIRRMLREDVSFYDDDEQRREFCYFIAIQYTRTKQVRESALANFGAYTVKGVETSHVWPVMAELVAMEIGMRLYASGSEFKLTLVENSSNTPFITGDQPIINVHGEDDFQPPTELEFFYPLSPSKAMVMHKQDTERPPHIGAIAANTYNVMMARNSHEQLFSNSEEYLLTFKNVVGRSGRGQRLKS